MAGMFARPLRNPHTWLLVYLAILAAIAFWPCHVDRDMGWLLAWLNRVVPPLTYPRVEFAANIALFVPFGVLLMFILRSRYLIVPLVLVASVGIETVQSLMGGRRTPSLLDVLANVTGACVGMLVVAFIEWARAQRGVTRGGRAHDGDAAPNRERD